MAEQKNMSKSHLLTFMIPDPISLDSLSAKYDPSALETMHRRNMDSFAYIIGTIFQKTITFLSDDEDGDDLWIYMSATDMRTAIGENYNSYRDFLIHQQIISCDEEYTPDVKSYGFQISRSNRFPTKVYPYELKDHLRRRTVSKLLEQQRAERSKLIRYNYSHLETHFKAGKLMIYKDAAREWVERRLQKDMQNTTQALVSPEVSAQRAHQFIDKILQKQYHLSPDNTSGRFHSVITSCKKELRNFLHYDGKQLVSLDLKNSQPYLFEGLFKPEFWDAGQFSFRRLFPRGYQAVKGLTPQKKKNAVKSTGMWQEEYRMIEEQIAKKQIKPLITMLREVRENRHRTGFAQLNLRSLSLQGQLYERLLQEFSGQFYDDEGEDRFKDRDMVKKRVLWLLYLNPRRQYTSPEFYAPYKKFAELFPVECGLINLIKEDRYQNFPILLQRMESWLMLQKIAGELEKHIPLFTIHDSIVTTASHADVVEARMRSTLEKYIGAAPTISREYWSPSNLMS